MLFFPLRKKRGVGFAFELLLGSCKAQFLQVSNYGKHVHASSFFPWSKKGKEGRGESEVGTPCE